VNGGFLVLLLAMFGFMYFLLIRPQRQQQRKHTELLSSLKPGDEVVTAGGIYGEVVQLDAERVMLEIDEDVRIAVARLEGPQELCVLALLLPLRPDQQEVHEAEHRNEKY
jgi:preprotein translocase subunit YajC